MKGTEVISAARSHFGELTELTLEDSTLEAWVNEAMREVYDQLYVTFPTSEMRPFVKESSVTLADGEGALEETWDRVLDVRDGAASFIEVAPETLHHIDTNQFFAPKQAVWAVQDNTIWVRPDSIPSVDVVRLEPPSTITDFSAEITGLGAKWHTALVWLVTSYAYAQEEDLAQADHYRGRYLRMMRQPEPEQEQAQEAR